MLRFVITLASLLSLAGWVAAQSVQETIVIGGTSVPFTLARVGNATYVSWPGFSATTASDGSLHSGSEQIVGIYSPAGSYSLSPPESVVRVTLTSGNTLGYLQVQSSIPSVSIYPINGATSTWPASAGITVTAGTVSYSN